MSGETAQASRQWPQRLRYLAFLVLATWLLCEVALRFMYREPWHQRLVAAQSQSERLPYHQNPDGFRDRAYPRDKPADVRRILVLGDSFTFGSGVREDSAVFVERVERALNPDHGLSGVREVQMLNAGVPGSVPTDWLETFGAMATAFQPDVVLVVFFLRDGTALTSIDHFFGPIRNSIGARNASSPLYQVSALYRAIRDVQDRHRVADDYTSVMHQGYFGSERETAAWRKERAALETLFERAREQRMGTGLVVFPVLAGLGDDRYPFAEIVDLLVEFGAQQKVATHDLLGAFSGHYGPDLWVSAYDQHPNELGHEIAAEDMTPFVRALLAQTEASRAGASAAAR